MSLRGRSRPCPLTDSEWAALLQAIAAGKPVRHALRELRRSDRVLYSYLNCNPERREQWRRALHLARAKRSPTLLQMNAILSTLVRNPGMSARSACALHGIRGRSPYQLFLDATAGPEWSGRYLRAKRLQRSRAFDDLRESIESAPNLTRAFRKGLNQELCRLTRLEPRRSWPKKQRTPQEQLLRDIRRRARRASRRSE